MANLSDIIEKIQKIIQIAERSDKPGEVAAAQARVQELITKYQIKEAQIHGHVGSGGIISIRVETYRPYRIDKSVLLNVIAKYNYCKVLRGEDYCLVFGYSSDIDLVITIYNALVNHMMLEMKTKLASFNKDAEARTDPKAWAHSFFSGYCVAVGERIKESKAKAVQEVESTGTSVALVMRDKEHSIEEFWQNQDRKPAAARSLTTVSGYEHGIISGKSADIQQNKLGK